MTRLQNVHLRECSDPDTCLTCIILNPEHHKLEESNMLNGWIPMYADQEKWAGIYEGYYVNGLLIKFRMV